MSDHPYPEHIVEAVADTIAGQILVFSDWHELSNETKHSFLRDADEVLERLWHSIRIDDFFDLDRLDESNIDVLLVDKHGFEVTIDSISGLTDEEAADFFPLRVVYWGEKYE
jgi:hypothetical protein